MATQAIAMTARPPTTPPAITAVLLEVPLLDLVPVLLLLEPLSLSEGGGVDEVGVTRGLEPLFEGEADRERVFDVSEVGVAGLCCQRRGIGMVSIWYHIPLAGRIS